MIVVIIVTIRLFMKLMGKLVKLRRTVKYSSVKERGIRVGWAKSSCGALTAEINIQYIGRKE